MNCPLGVPHPSASRDPLKSMFPLGCSLCRMEKGAANYLGAQRVNVVEEIKLADAVRGQNSDKLAQKYN